MRWLIRVLKSPPVWIGTGLLAVTAFILHQIPHSTEVTLHVTTENLAFALPGTASMQPLLQGLQLTELTLRGLAEMVLEVKELQQQGTSLTIPGKRLTLRAQYPASSYMLRALPNSDLRLKHVNLAGNSEALLSADPSGQLQVNVKSPQVIRLEVEVIGERFRLLVGDGVALLNAQGQEIALRSVSSPRTLEVTPVSSRLVFEQPANTSLGLDMTIAGQQEAGKPQDLSRTFGRLHMQRVTFPYRGVSAPRETVIKEFWLEPFVLQDKAKTHVVVKLREDDEFTLQALRFSAQGLICEMVGTTNTVFVGKESPHENQVPSWLEYLVKHNVVFQTLCTPLKVC
jgi:hypothetical protein